jgi:hypothetical protein
MAMVFTDFTPRRYLIHWLASAALILSTYNPFGHSYYHWVTTEGGSPFLKALAGLVLLILYAFTLWWTVATVGRVGVIAGGTIWGLASYEALKWIPAESPIVRQLVVLVLLASIVAAGFSWSHFRTRLTGVIDKRYVIYHGKAEKKKRKYAAMRAARRAEQRARAVAAQAAVAQAAAARAAAVARAVARAPVMQPPIGAPPGRGAPII